MTNVLRYDAHREGHVKRKAETTVVQIHVKEQLDLLDNGQSQEGFSPVAFEGHLNTLILDFSLQNSKRLDFCYFKVPGVL